MSTAAVSNARRDFWPWLGHNAWWLMFPVTASILAGAVFSTTSSVANLIWAVVNLTAWFTLYLAGHKHDHSLCEPCIAEMPLDPKTAVQKNLRWLRQFHWFADHLPDTKRRVYTLLVVFGVVFAALVLFAPDPVRELVLVLVLGIYGPWGTWTTRVHTQLQPWCPFCDDDDGGQFDPIGTPDPSVKADR